MENILSKKFNFNINPNADGLIEGLGISEKEAEEIHIICGIVQNLRKTFGQNREFFKKSQMLEIFEGLTKNIQKEILIIALLKEA